MVCQGSDLNNVAIAAYRVVVERAGGGVIKNVGAAGGRIKARAELEADLAKAGEPEA